MSRAPLAAAALLATALATPLPAAAVVLSEDELADESTELGAIVRSFTFGLFGEVLEPPFQPVDANPSGVGLLDLRLYVSHRTARWKLVVHNPISTTVRSHGIGTDFAVGRSVTPPRWLPLYLDLVDEPTVAIRSEADWLYLGYSRGRATVTLGRQPITLGRGKIWRPTDLVGTFAVTEVDTEYKPGADAIRLDYSPSDRTTILVVGATGELERDRDLDLDLDASVVLAHGKRAWDSGEVGALAAFVRGDAVVGLDGVYDTGSFEVYGEATATVVTGRSLRSPRVDTGDVVPRALLGATFRLGADVTFSPEVFYDGFGAWNPADYLPVLASDRVAVGEQILAGQLHASGVIAWQIHPLLDLSGAILVNPRDPSALPSVALSYSFADDVMGILGGYAAFGRRPDGLEPRSEFGLFPTFLFAEVKAVL